MMSTTLRCLILTVILECIFFFQTYPSSCAFGFLYNILGYHMINVLLKKRRSLPDNFLNFLFALLVQRCCNLDLSLAYHFLIICSTFLPSNIWLTLSVAIFSIPISTSRTSTTWSYYDSSAASINIR